MRTLLLLMLLYVALGPGCAGRVAQVAPPPGAAPNLAALVPGHAYAISVKGSPGETRTYHGELVRCSDEQVVLKDSALFVTMERSPPIPILGRMFRTTSLGIEDVPGEFSLKRSEIESAEEIGLDWN